LGNKKCHGHPRLSACPEVDPNDQNWTSECVRLGRRVGDALMTQAA
jgi:hypothetical protein